MRDSIQSTLLAHGPPRAVDVEWSRRHVAPVSARRFRFCLSSETTCQKRLLAVRDQRQEPRLASWSLPWLCTSSADDIRTGLSTFTLNVTHCTYSCSSSWPARTYLYNPGPRIPRQPGELFDTSNAQRTDPAQDQAKPCLTTEKDIKPSFTYDPTRQEIPVENLAHRGSLQTKAISTPTSRRSFLTSTWKLLY